MNPLFGMNRQPPKSPMELRVENGHVEIIFPDRTKWVRLTPEQAEAIGHKLIEFSRTAKGRIILPTGM